MLHIDVWPFSLHLMRTFNVQTVRVHSLSSSRSSQSSRSSHNTIHGKRNVNKYLLPAEKKVMDLWIIKQFMVTLYSLLSKLIKKFHFDERPKWHVTAENNRARERGGVSRNGMRDEHFQTLATSRIMIISLRMARCHMAVLKSHPFPWPVSLEIKIISAKMCQLPFYCL